MSDADGDRPDEAAVDEDAERVALEWRRRHGVHRIAQTLRWLGFLAAAGCLLAGAAAVVLWAWGAIVGGGS